LNNKGINVLFTCIGRRVSLLRCFRAGARELDIRCEISGTDNSQLSSALQLCDSRFAVKPVTHPDYLSELLRIVKSEKIGLVVPTVDLDLRVLAANIDKFAALGCRVLISSPDVIDVCQDKRKTYSFLMDNNLETPVTCEVASLPAAGKIDWPCFLKPWDGSAGRGNAVVRNIEELRFFSRRIPNCIVQEFIDGSEHTCDVYVDFEMKVRCVVPRKRIEVRAGEVSKSQIVKNTNIMKQAANLVEKLGAGPGVITLQLFLTKDNDVKFIEINPRFGGGVPLSIKAGANFPRWILQEMTGERPDFEFDGFQDGLTMLRYDGEVWLDSNKKTE